MVLVFQVTQSANETAIVSTLVFTPDPDDDGHTLRCIADNAYISGSAIDDVLTLDIVCKYMLFVYIFTKKRGE